MRRLGIYLSTLLISGWLGLFYPLPAQAKCQHCRSVHSHYHQKGHRYRHPDRHSQKPAKAKPPQLLDVPKIDYSPVVFQPSYPDLKTRIQQQATMKTSLQNPKAFGQTNGLLVDQNHICLPHVGLVPESNHEAHYNNMLWLVNYPVGQPSIKPIKLLPP